MRIACLGAIAIALAVAAPASGLERVIGVLHVHSDLSTGDLPLDDVLRNAEAAGVQAILLTENYLLRVEYGLPPFRALTRVTREEPSILATDPQRYLEQVAELQRRNARVLLLPGVEVMPHYFWTGSPLALSMQLHNTQKNLLVLGVTDLEALKGLLATGNRHDPRYTWQSLADVAPVVLVVPGLVLLARKRRHHRRLGRTVVVAWRRRWVAGLALSALGVFAAVRAWPFTVDRYPPWVDAGLEPHQALIDQVERLGGATIWSFPEAADSGDRKFGPVQVTWRTDPYSDDLLRTFRYTAFGAVYEQPTHFTDPGLGWDRLLRQYAAGERSRPAWAVAESGFHGFTRGKRLGDILTVFFVDERSPAALLDALKRGRMYALRRSSDAALVLNDFSIAAPNATAMSGETLKLLPGTRVQVRVAIEATGERSQAVRVTLVRNGTVAEAWSGSTPLSVAHDDTYDGTPLVYRVDVRGRAPHQLVTNPIFVTAP